MSTWNRGRPQAKGVVVYHRPWTAREDRWPSSVVKGGEAAGEEKGDGAAVGGRPQPLMAATDGVSVCASSRVLAGGGWLATPALLVWNPVDRASQVDCADTAELVS